MNLLETTVPLWTIFGSEFLGTALLILLGVGVVANVLLPKSNGNGGGTLMINWGWGIGVMTGVYAAYKTGGHLNPAVTIGLWVAGKDFAPGIPGNFENALIYIVAQLLGAMFGAGLCWLAYKKQYDLDLDPALKLGTFCTAPQVRAYGWNFLTEAIATWVLLMWVFVSGYTNTVAGQSVFGLGPLGVTLLIVGIGASLGGPTGYAINPARDLGPRLMHAFLPIKGKGGSDWAYSWVPIAGPLFGAIVAGVCFRIFWH